MVNLKAGKTKYEVGFSYFNPGGVEAAGKFQDLLNAGQCDVWEISPNGEGGSTTGAQAKCRRDGNRLKITVDGGNWTEKLFADQPKTVVFESGGSQLKSDKTEVKVKYRQKAKAKKTDDS